MTPEQLDDYELLVSTAPFSPERTIIRALRAAWVDIEAAQTRATQAEKLMGQTVERLMKSEELSDTLRKERDDARAVADQCKDTIAELREQAVELRASHDTVRETAANFEKAWGTAVEALGEARAEVKQLRSVLRLLWEEAQDESRCHLSQGHMISQPCWEAVTAALKEAE